jgi:hypothetical protein
MSDMEKLIRAPRTTQVHRDADGKISGATSSVATDEKK